MAAKQTYRSQKKTLIIFDEITWMAWGDKTFLPKLKNAWDLYFSKIPNLTLALSGSLSLWIEENILSSTGYLGRIDLKLFIDELPLKQCKAFWQTRVSVSPYEMLKILSITGGVPKYLELINPQLSAEKNILQLCFDPSGFLHEEFKNIFSDLFANRNQIYQKITESLVNGSKQQGEILEDLGQEKSGTLSHYLSDLEKAGFISQDFSWDFCTGKKSKTRIYRLRDNYSRFYLKYILPNKGRAITSLSQLPQWNTMLGLQFENLILANRDLINHALKINPEDVVNSGPYLQHKNAKQQGCQIDFLIQTRFNTLYLCEIKFSKNSIDAAVIDEVKEKIKRIKIPRGFDILPVLIHVNGITDSVEDAHYFIQIVDFSELLL